MKITFEVGDVFIFNKEVGTYRVGQVVILDRFEEGIDNWHITGGDIRDEGDQACGSVSGSGTWLAALYATSAIEYVGHIPNFFSRGGV